MSSLGRLLVKSSLIPLKITPVTSKSSVLLTSLLLPEISLRSRIIVQPSLLQILSAEIEARVELATADRQHALPPTGSS